ncbi:MAG TPA: DUF4328 domain-containing protein [bacterium]|nr:DUF4328 domain-containing protein [bacterium]
MPTMKWFVVEGQDEIGPLGPNGLRKLIRRGQVLPGTMIRREDHEFPVRADHVRGLFDADVGPQQKPRMHGPFTSLRALGWFNFAVMIAWVAIGVAGVVRATGSPADEPPPLLGIGLVPATVLFFATGVTFCYWLWNARCNLPHLIQARTRFAPHWTISGWFLPVANLIRPYQVIEEVDRLSAEALAEGDASVRAESVLLVPWWLSTLALVALTVATLVHPANVALHVWTGVALVVAAGTGAAVFLRITLLQERAHAAHAQPVRLHHRLRRRGEAESA